MARIIPSPLLNARWMNLEFMSRHWCGRRMCLGGVKVKGRGPMCSSGINVGGEGSLDFGNRQFSRVRRRLVSHAHLTHNFEKSDAWYSMNGSSNADGLRFVTTNINVNLKHQIVKLDVQELPIPDQSALSPNTADQQKDGCAGLVTSGQQENAVDASGTEEILVTSVAISVVGNAEKEVPISNSESPVDERKWWQIPDLIEKVLPLPADFEARVEVLFKSFGSQIDSRELLLRVLKLARALNFHSYTLIEAMYAAIPHGSLLSTEGMCALGQVHKSYYDQRIPASIKDQEYVKPHSPLFIDSGEVKQQYVEGLPSRTTSYMIFSDAHGEVRSQLAILGDAVIGLAVSSLLVRQHSSAGTITERKCQLVSNSNLSRVWRTLLGPQDFVLSFGDSSSHIAAQNRMMADSCEAYIGALYAEKGFETAFNCVTNALLPLLVQADSIRNPIHALNVHSSMAFQVLPEYRLIGVDHENTQHQVCRVRVYVKGIRMATGMGVNQKLARVDAARKALEKWPTVFTAV